MRILLANDTFPPDVNGNANFTRALALGLASRGHEVHVLRPAPNTCLQNLQDPSHGNLTIHDVRSVPLLGFYPFRISPIPFCYSEISRITNDLRPDVVHIHSHLFVGRGAVRATLALGLPLVATSHFMPRNLSVHVALPKLLVRAFERRAWADLVRVLNGADVVVSPSSVAAQHLVDIGVTRPSMSISCGVDDHLIYANPDRPALRGGALSSIPSLVPNVESSGRPDNTPPRCLFVGRLEKEKNVAVLVRAWALVSRRIRAELLIVGQGRQSKRLRRLVRSLGLEDNVFLTGFVDDATLYRLYRKCNVFCNPGTAELQSLVVLEAMAAGLPVVAANTGALPELVHHSGNGYTFEPMDHVALACYLTRLLSDRRQRTAMGRVARQMVSGHARERTLDDYEELYCTLAAGTVSRRVDGSALPP